MASASHVSENTNSFEAIPSEINYFDQDFIQTSIVDEFDRDFIPLASLAGDGPIEFLVRGADNLLLDLNNSKIEIKVRILRDNGTNITDDDNVGPVNLLLHALFAHVEVELCGKSYGDPNSLYPYKAYIETLLNCPVDVLESRVKAEGWEKDTADRMDVTNPDLDNKEANIGLKTRAIDFRESRTVTLIGRPHHELFHQEKDIPPNCDLKLRLFRNRAPFCLLAEKPKQINDRVNYRIDIRAARFFLRTKVLSPHVSLAFEQAILKTNFRLRPAKNPMKHVSIPVGVSCFELDNVYMGLLPDRIFVCLVGDENMAGSFYTNPFEFGHYNLSQIGIKVNSEAIPRPPLSLSFRDGEEDYLRGYMLLLEALGIDEGDRSIDLTPEEWASGYTIFGFKITPGPIGASGARSIQRSGSLRIEVKFSTPTAININLLLYAEYPNLVEIDRFRNMITNT